MPRRTRAEIQEQKDFEKLYQEGEALPEPVPEAVTVEIEKEVIVGGTVPDKQTLRKALRKREALML